jgi:pyrimidine-nucleoside phosphorylase
MRIVDIIEKKRDGKELAREEFEYFIQGYLDGSIPDYQAAALVMAMFIKGMNSRETAVLTEIMADSGERADLSAIPGIKVDKHSTGGVGDKTTLIVAPIVAACGVPVAKMSGRGLGFTGGTIDKLESIKGLETQLSMEEFIGNVKEIGIAIASQTGNLAPADKKLYALRDVTATVNSIPLIASSIMSKKIASGADKILLDVKTGNGAFMKTLDESILLAREMVSIGEHAGKKTVALVTNMDSPLGNAIGNALEVKEAVSVLKGHGPEDIEAISIELAARMLELAGKGTIERCREIARGSVSNGSALKKLGEMSARQGAMYMPWDEKALDDAPVVENIKAPFDGYISSIHAELAGKASMILGAGREKIESSIDYAAGIILYKKTGDKVEKGDIIASLHTSMPEKLPEAGELLLEAYAVSAGVPEQKPLILAYIDGNKVERF